MKKLMLVVLVALASGFSPAQLSNYGTTPRIIGCVRLLEIRTAPQA